MSCDTLADRLLAGMIRVDVGGRGGLSDEWVGAGTAIGILTSPLASAGANG